MAQHTYQSLKPIPSAHYTARQLEARRLFDLQGYSNYLAGKRVSNQLHRLFVRAWGLRVDLGLALDMKCAVAHSCRAFDHCTTYFQPDTGAHVVVTQPYLKTPEALAWVTPALTIVDWWKPEIIAAPEWAFYYPGWATMIIIKFPPGYEDMLLAWARLWSPAAEAALHLN